MSVDYDEPDLFRDIQCGSHAIAGYLRHDFVDDLNGNLDPVQIGSAEIFRLSIVAKDVQHWWKAA